MIELPELQSNWRELSCHLNFYSHPHPRKRSSRFAYFSGAELTNLVDAPANIDCSARLQSVLVQNVVVVQVLVAMFQLLLAYYLADHII